MRLANLREMSTGQWSIIRLIKSKSLRLPLLLVCAMQAGQQLSGINAVSFFFQKKNLFVTDKNYYNFLLRCFTTLYLSS